MQNRSTRRIVSWNCDQDILDKLTQIPKRDRSNCINRALRQHLEIPEVKGDLIMSNNVKVKNLDSILSYMYIHKFAQTDILARRMELELGVTTKRAKEYIELLVMNDKLVQSGKYTVLAGWKPTGHPYPGTEAYTRWSSEQELKEFNERTKSHPQPLNEQESTIFGATAAQPECQHTDHPFNCRACGEQSCLKCCASFSQDSHGIMGICKRCG